MENDLREIIKLEMKRNMHVNPHLWFLYSEIIFWGIEYWNYELSMESEDLFDYYGI